MLVHPKRLCLVLSVCVETMSALTQSQKSISHHVGLSSYVDTCEIILLQGELSPPYLGRLGCLEVRQVLMIVRSAGAVGESEVLDYRSVGQTEVNIIARVKRLVRVAMAICIQQVEARCLES